MDLTLSQIASRLYDIHRDLAIAQQNLVRARDTEVEAKEVYRVATARATLSPECPRAKRGENGVTVADRTAWVDMQTASERFAAAVAEAACEAARDALRVTITQSSVVQSLSSLAKAEMSLGSGPGQA